MTIEPKPECVTQAHLVFLDELRESGTTNMFGAASYVKDEFDLTPQDARLIHAYWMKTFGREDR